jgi:hypothetical protein
MSTGAVPGIVSALVMVLALALATDARSERLAVCVFSFHGPEEVAVFKSRLPPEAFEIVDLSPSLAATGGAETWSAPSSGGVGEGAAPWLPRLCRSDLRCDVVVISAEFAGRFFGRSGASLSLEEMEEAACRPQCDGLFHVPSEVFLLACNTLATKDEDLRGPDAYLQVLLNHDFDRATAERVVAMRYGPLGPSFRQALRRAFMGVPRIYGFSSVAPLGQYTAPMLERYFRSVGDYQAHLGSARRDGASNRALLDAFAGTGLVQVPGLSRDEPAAADRQLICTLYDEGESIAARLRIVRQLMERPDRLAFIPTVQVFLDRHPPEQMVAEEREVFQQIERNDAAREQVLRLVRELDVSALELELAHFSVHLGWMTPEELHVLATDAARQLLRRPLTTGVVDVMCELPKHESVGEHFGSDDLPAILFADPEGIRLISCLAPPGERVSERLAGALASGDPAVRTWAAHALTRRVPLSERVLLEIAPHLRDPSRDVAMRLRWIFLAQSPLPDDVRDAVAAADAGPAHAAEVPADR